MPPLLALLISLALAAPALAQDGPRLETNQSYIEQLAQKIELPLADPLAMFGFVLGGLPERVKIYPTENYYYFHFMQNGVRYSGNIRLDRSDRDNGKLHFAYYPDRGELQDEAGTYRLLGEAEGVKVERLERFLYRVSHAGKQVVFELNDLSAVKPPASALGPDEKFLGPVFDESGIRFFLIFNPRLKIFHYVLDETAAVPEEFVAAKKSDRILIGKRTAFAFYRDHRLERKILIGVFEGNAMANNYFDGPFDQLPDNFIAGEELRDAILAVDPRLKGKIDRFGSDPDGATRFLIGPYAHYRGEEELQPFHDCAVSRRVPRERYYACFVHIERRDGRTLAQPAATMVGKRTPRSPRP